MDVTALYAELAHRLAYQEDKDARQALNLAELRRDARAKEARDLAFEDKLADATIAQIEAGKPKAQEELERLAGLGNRRARQHLGLDKAPDAIVRASATSASPTATVSPVEAPKAASPTANEAKPAPAKVERP